MSTCVPLQLQSLSTLKKCEDTHLGEEVERNWSEILMQTYNFDYLYQQVGWRGSTALHARTHTDGLKAVFTIILTRYSRIWRKYFVQHFGPHRHKIKICRRVFSVEGNRSIIIILPPLIKHISCPWVLSFLMISTIPFLLLAFNPFYLLSVTSHIKLSRHIICHNHFWHSDHRLQPSVVLLTAGWDWVIHAATVPGLVQEIHTKWQQVSQAYCTGSWVYCKCGGTHVGVIFLHMVDLYMGVKVVLADWKVKTPCHANAVFINKMLSLNRKKIKFISKRHYVLAHYYCNVPHLDCDAQEGRTLPSCASHVVTFLASRYVTSM